MTDKRDGCDYLFDSATIEVDALSEAVEALGFVKPQAVENLLPLVRQCRSLGFKAVAVQYRKTLPQLSKEAKRKLGIRSNAFMSQAAANELTDKGKKNPLEAHLKIFWRAAETIARADAIKRAVDLGRQDGIAEHVYIKIFGCNFCSNKELERLNMSHPNELSPFPSETCESETCGAYFSVFVDWVALAK